MKKIIGLFVRKALNDQRGQVLPWVAVVLVGLLGMAGLSIDVGRAYVVHSQLQNYANAAALAAAGEVYNTSSTDNATTVATTYGAGKGGENVNTALGSPTPTVTTKCLNMLMPGGTGCTGSSPANAVQVKESASIPTYLMKLFGFSTLNLSATATASMQGMAHPWNVAIIVDSSGSMATSDSNCGGVTEFQCALAGVQTLLMDTNPNCSASMSNCSGGYDFRAALFAFPNVLTSVNNALPTVGSTTYDSQSLDINCGGTPATWKTYSKQPLAAPYTLPKPGATLATDSKGRVYMTYNYTQTTVVNGKPKITTTPWTASYQITPFDSDYYAPASSSTSGLNANSDIVKAVGYGSTSGCLTYTFGVDGTGSGSGFGNTYFASSIYEAQAALALQKAEYPNSQSAIIFLSDGQANASYYSKNSSAYGTANSSNQFANAYEFPGAPANSIVGPTTTGYPVPTYYTPATIADNSLGYDTLSSDSSGSNQSRSGTSKGIYPDWYDQCQQAVAAAQYAANATGNFKVDRMYAVAYGAESSGCYNGWSIGATDTTGVTTGTLNQPVSGHTILPCTTMEDIASDWAYFYSDNQQTGNVNLGCTDNNHTTVALKDIFASIAATFTNPRLLPNNAQ
jgi:Flp pilus assembly protein TadG